MTLMEHSRRLITAGGVLIVLAFVTSAHAEILETEGTVKAVDADARTLTIERETATGTKTLDLEVNKKAGSVSSLKVGDRIAFSYDPNLEVVTKLAKQSIKAPKGVAAGDDDAARPFLDKLLAAIEENNYDSYVADFTASFKAVTTKQTVAAISKELSPRMKKGYDVSFLTEMKQRGVTVYLWKVAYKDGGDDGLVRLVLEDGKVSGLLLGPAFAR